MSFLVVGQLRLSTKTDVPSQSQMFCCVWQLSILFRNRSSTAIGMSDCKHCERIYNQDTCQPYFNTDQQTRYLPAAQLISNTSKQAGKNTFTSRHWIEKKANVVTCIDIRHIISLSSQYPSVRKACWGHFGYTKNNNAQIQTQLQPE